MKPASASSSVTAGLPEKSTKVELATDLYREAQALGINVSAFCEQKLRAEIHARKQQDWNEQHAHFLAVYNKTVETEGVALEAWRAF